MTPLRQKMIDAMLVRGFAERTHRSYLQAVTQLAKYYHRSPDVLTTDELQAYLLYLAKERKLSASTCRLALNAMHFLYVQVLGREDFTVTLVAPQNPQRIPELLTPAEVAAIINAGKTLKHRNLLRVCYGCGLRVSELVNLQVKHIESHSHLLRVVQGKGAKDRLVILSDSLLTHLRQYWRVCRPQTWLFYGARREKALSVSSAQKIFQTAKQQAGIEKVGGIHSLRHAYATHQLAAGMPVYQLQRLLGHNHLQSTMRYVHWVPQQQAVKADDLIAALVVNHEH